MGDNEWLVLGDFNEIMDDSEVLGGWDLEAPTCLTEADLSSVPMQGHIFTWCNNRQGPSRLWRRLDRMVANLSLFMRYPDFFYQSANTKISDHSPKPSHNLFWCMSRECR
ncbi:hypothetical protein BUALT_Bualt10G0023500 [Buddleja alternifolia]|uniref:Uncharacterized protein n=1 Tax=Buddleja alternifolia TaxID=168488 RepID=A0AAV6X448_9LAMI|nr:hypothetical protein BUALT_Bualt10G0023500 [Buddleja alternifolia]